MLFDIVQAKQVLAQHAVDGIVEAHDIDRRTRLAPGHPQWSAYRAELWHVGRVGPAYGNRETLVQVPLRG